MRLNPLIKATLVGLCLSFPVQADHEQPAYSSEFSPERDPFADGRAAIALATEADKHVLIEVGGDWCVWCKMLERMFDDNAEIHAALRDGFVLLKVNHSETNPNDDFIDGLPRLTGYPKLYVARSDGTVIHAQDPSAFLVDGRYDPVRVLAMLQKWSPTKPSP